jgi:hypothetical protein
MRVRKRLLLLQCSENAVRTFSFPIFDFRGFVELACKAWLMIVADACTIFPPAALQRHEELRRVRISSRQSRGRGDNLGEHEYRLLSIVVLIMEFLFWRMEVNILNKFLKWSVKKWCGK